MTLLMTLVGVAQHIRLYPTLACVLSYDNSMGRIHWYGIIKTQNDEV